MELTEIDKKCIEVMKSNLNDGLKIELITMLKNSETSVINPSIYIEPYTVKSNDKIGTWTPPTSTGDYVPYPEVSGYNPAKDMYEKAQADIAKPIIV